MNILQSFVGCLYPESSRTDSIDSIESIDHDDFSNRRFPASNIDEGMQQVSRGELQLTGKDLIYFRPSEEPIRWPLEYIRRYGYKDGDGTLYLECGRRSKTGEAIFAFRVDCGEDLVDKLREKIDKSPSMNSSPKSDLCQVTHPNSRSLYTPSPKSPSSDAYTTTAAAVDESHRPVRAINNQPSQSAEFKVPSSTGPLDPLSYTSIDFDTTKALNESAQAHAANRVK